MFLGFHLGLLGFDLGVPTRRQRQEPAQLRVLRNSPRAMPLSGCQSHNTATASATCKPLSNRGLGVFRVGIFATLKTAKAVIFSNLCIAPNVSRPRRSFRHKRLNSYDCTLYAGSGKSPLCSGCFAIRRGPCRCSACQRHNTATASATCKPLSNRGLGVFRVGIFTTLKTAKAVIISDLRAAPHVSS